MINLETKIKRIVIAALLAFITVSGVLAVLPIGFADESGEDSTYEELKILLQNRRVNYDLWRRDAIVTRFIKNGAYELLEGAVIAVTPHILVIEFDGQAINVIVPGKWVYDGDVLDTQDLMDGQPFGLGDVIHLEALMLKLEKDDHAITSYLAFSISIGDDAATALLPFNVETD